MNGKQLLLAGAAKRKITPPAELLTEVRGLMGQKFVAVADDIFVRVLALKIEGKTALFCVFDLDKAPNPQSSMQIIHEKFGIEEEYVTFCGIHTHSAPILGKRAKEPHNNIQAMGEKTLDATERYEAYVRDLVVEAVAEACEALQPARLRFSTDYCGCNVNRCADYYRVDQEGNMHQSLREGPNILGPVDHNVYVLAVETENGNPLAFLINYAMHNTVMFMNRADAQGNCRISGDVGGNVAQMVEKKYGAVAMWCSGAAGDVAPLRPDLRFHMEEGEAPFEFEYRSQYGLLTQLCANHFASVVKAIEKRPDPLEGVGLDAAVNWTQTPGRTVVREGKGKEQRVVITVSPDEPPYQIRLHLTRIGKLLFVGIGGELYSSYALELQKIFYEYHVIFINHDASLIRDAGYILDDDTWRRVDENLSSERALPGTPPPYEKGYIANAITEVIRQTIDAWKA